MLDSLRDLPIVGDVRGMGYFWAIELVKDRATKASFTSGGVRVAAARLPVRRAVRPRADLPRRRPRRPGHPALAAADRRPGAVRRDGGGPAARARGGVATRLRRRLDVPCSPLRDLVRDLDVRLVAGEAGARPPRPLGAHLRARRPDAVAVGRRAAADHRPAARATRRRAPTSTGSPAHGLAGPRASAPASARRACPRRWSRRPTELGFPLFEVPVRGAVHRAHREGLHAPRQRARRGAPARDRPRTSGSSGSCSPSAGSTASPARWPRWSAGRR